MPQNKHRDIFETLKRDILDGKFEAGKPLPSAPALMRKFGVDPRKERVEVSPEMYEHGGHPIIDSKMMTEIPGLFHARGSGTTGVVAKRYGRDFIGIDNCEEYLDIAARRMADMQQVMEL